MTKKTLIFIPTYNEKDNVERMISEILSLHIPDTDLLFIDDNSTDGTGDILDGISRKQTNLTVIHRSGKLGVGSAHKDGVAYAYERNYDRLITMDADFTHPPSYIPKLIERSDGFDIVVPSRFLQADALSDWSLLRKLLTKVGHLLTEYVLRMQYDASGAFRLYNLKTINSEAFHKVASNGYSFFFESLFVLNFNRYSICEIPIILNVRTFDSSKMKISDAFVSLMFLFKLFFIKTCNPGRFSVSKEPTR
jgi:dolichol-phosphate mannosyltransferase